MKEKPRANRKTGSHKKQGSAADDSAALRIEAAAIRCRNGEIVTLPPPNRHYDIGMLMESQGKERPSYADMGFLLSDGTWCDRRTAMKIAIAAGQVSKRTDPELTTNDLW
jgi:hypothetical protein